MPPTVAPAIKGEDKALPTASMKELMEAGVHFGHQTRRWNPKMRSYIYGERNGIYIIDLEQTSRALDRACEFFRKAASERKNVIFVGTKKQACDIVQEEARRAEVHYINRRWLGGMLTNFDTIRLRINRLKELEEMRDSGDFYRRPKKELAVLNRELYKLDKSLGGIKSMKGRPDILFVIDQRHEDIAVAEANKVGVTIVGIIDTNCNPDGIDLVIPGNDDAIRSIKLITQKIADAIIEGKQGQAALPIPEQVQPEAIPEQTEAAISTPTETDGVVADTESDVDTEIDIDAEIMPDLDLSPEVISQAQQIEEELVLDEEE